MKIINKLVIITVVLTLSKASYGQYCKDFYNEFCFSAENSNFRLNGQSRSTIFNKGEKSELNILVYKKMDYRISYCTTENLGDKIFFKVYEVNKVRVKRVIEGDTIVTVERRKQLLYDNSEHGFINEIEFSAEDTRRLVVEISVPGDESSTATTKSRFLKKAKIGCLGLLVEHMKTPTSGF